MLTNDQKQQYEERGWVRIPSVFSEADAEKMVDRIWAVMHHKFGVVRDDAASWNIQMGYGFSELKKDPAFMKVGSETTVAVIDALLGKGQWKQPSNWGQLLVTFPEFDADWTVPAKIWHTDFGFQPVANPFGVMVFGFLSDVQPRGGGTVIVEGSHRIVEQFVANQPFEKLAKMKQVRLELMKSEPWLRDLSTPGNGKERLERFMKFEKVAGISVRVMELTGAPGDIIVCQPWLLHAVAPNRSEVPRMMCVQRIHVNDA